MDGYSTIDLKSIRAARTPKDSNDSGLPDQSGLVVRAIPYDTRDYDRGARYFDGHV
jgi:hypothetical protein